MTQRPVPQSLASATAADLGVAHLHINDEDLPRNPDDGRVAPVREAYRPWQPNVASPIVRKILEAQGTGPI
jgi:hypothetical protein